ncbi:uncharacterized protein LOC114243191 [Bombyx mandarina]|uniref:Uncharacterized protein LOC114243191 n=1 Tax=Bombyx mandarina TaxID=7092 RepID=A0A6J2JM61_BOMMA|nr:uncharacterized protein LOC114243191 [Bombyx mandarina]
MRVRIGKVRGLLTKLLYVGCLWVLFTSCKNNKMISQFVSSFKLRNLLPSSTFFSEFNDYLISTPGCHIPNHAMMFTKAINYNHKCPVRAIFIKSLANNKILFQINKKQMLKYVKKSMYSRINCCYKFVTESKDGKLTYSKCSGFKNGGKVKLLQETIRVTCTVKNKKDTNIIYDDIYKVIIKRNDKKRATKLKPWNVLVLGMSHMSRMRFYNDMPKTGNFFKDNDWLDFRGFNKITREALSNVLVLLAGKTLTATKAQSLGGPVEKFIWNAYQNAGYVTAFGEDDRLQLLDNLARQLNIKPTDHKLQPIYRIDHRRIGNYMCTMKLPSGIHLLDYAHQFVDLYKNKNFFGFFWLSSYTQHYDGMPSLIDSEIAQLFGNIKNNGVLNNTFVIFLSETGMKSANSKSSIASYYEERLPMLFMWVPLEFRKKYINEYNNIKSNQIVLVTPYDINHTLKYILEFRVKLTNNSIYNTCPKCNGLFKNISLTRTCTGAGIDENVCTCRDYSTPPYNNFNVQTSLELAVSYIKDRARSVQTITCMICEEMELNSVISVHSYFYSNQTYYILAIQMQPRNMTYGVTVVVQKYNFSLVHPINSLTPPVTGRCAIRTEDTMYCACNVTFCNIQSSDSLPPQ